MRGRPGQCRWCGCTYYEPCPGSCGWANATQTLCTACINVDRAWSAVTPRYPNMRRAFFRGYMAGSDDERALASDVPVSLGAAVKRGALNPYPTRGQTATWWERGRAAGALEAR
jgi:hypothetical protein